jgi:hypothetical protein
MQRREFLTASLASALAAGAPANSSQASEAGVKAKSRDFYQLRHYVLARGPQIKIMDDYFRDALVPALNRLGISPVGVFSVVIGPLTPSYYVLMSSPSADALATVENRLDQDGEYLKAGANFFNAPSKEPPFLGVEVSLMQAFEKMPNLSLPAGAADHPSRIFELRTYKSPSQQDHEKKVGMFNSAEIALQTAKSMRPVFYGDTIAGPGMPNLTYMLAFDSLADREKKFDAFNSSAEWKSLSTQPQYPLEIVANISNIILSPTAYSQI